MTFAVGTRVRRKHLPNAATSTITATSVLFSAERASVEQIIQLGADYYWYAEADFVPVEVCSDCGCAEGDHAFGDAYRAYATQVINDGEARRDGVNVCLNCQSCGRNEEGE